MTSKRNTAVGLSNGSKTKQSKRQVSKETFHKWQRTYKREPQSLEWLCADMIKTSSLCRQFGVLFVKGQVELRSNIVEAAIKFFFSSSV